jgi:dTDP-4-dehydrorhamnose reductase
MKIWIVGSSGMLAHAVKQRLSHLGLAYTGTDLELDIADLPKLRDYARERQFTHVINCAAYTDVDAAEANEAKALAINADGAGNLAEIAAEIGATFVHYSTDYVFDGGAAAPYEEHAPTVPLGAYGRTKLAGEVRVLATAPREATGRRGVYVLRTSWLFGPAGKNFVKTILDAMRNKEEMRVVADQRGRPTYTMDLADATLGVLRLSMRGGHPPSGLYHYANSGETTWHGLTLDILNLARVLGFDLKAKSVAPIRTSEYPRPARRPAYSTLSTAKIERALGGPPRHYRTALAEYLPTLRAL